MIEPKAETEAAVEAARAAVESRRMDPPAKLVTRYGWVIAAGAAIVVAVAVARLRGEAPPLVVTQRHFAAAIGSEHVDVAALPPEERNIEVTLKSRGVEAARLIVTDSAGTALAPILVFSADADGAFRAVVAPRALAPHTGRATGFILAGSMPGVDLALEMLPRPLLSLGEKPDAPDSLLANAARRGGARVERIEIDEATR